MTLKFQRYAVAASLVAATLTGTTLSANALVVPAFKAGNWKGVAVSFEKSGAFTHCVASMTYRNGMQLMFSMTKAGGWSIGFANNAWSLEKGGRHNVKLRVDNGAVSSFAAQATNTRMVRVDLPNNLDLYDSVRNGQVLNVKAGGSLLKFALGSSDEMLKKLMDCVRQNRGLVLKKDTPNDTFGKKPFVQSTSNPSAHTTNDTVFPSKGERIIDAKHAAERVMNKTGIRYKYQQPKGGNGLYKTYDAVWSMPGFIGTMMILPSNDPTAVDAYVQASAKRLCNRGKFDSRFKTPRIMPDGAFQRFAACHKGNGKKTYAIYTAYPRRQGGFYVVQVYTGSRDLHSTLTYGDRIGLTALKQAEAS